MTSNNTYILETILKYSPHLIPDIIHYIFLAVLGAKWLSLSQKQSLFLFKNKLKKKNLLNPPTICLLT